jgi:hypothetical protein
VKAIYRYEVPIDDRPHRHILGGEVIGVASRLVDVVEFWAIHDDDGIQQQRAFQVFGTGQEIPADAVHVGTTIAPGGRFVWHLFEVPAGGTS